MLKNGQAVKAKVFVPTGKVVERKFFGEGEDEVLKYLVEFENADGEKGCRWYLEEEIEVV